MKTILLIAEAVTLAHVARPLCFARALDRSRNNIVLACDDSAAEHVRSAGFDPARIASISSDTFLRRLAAGRPLYDQPTLERYVSDDLALIQRVRPDLVVGDFRLSLSISCRLAKVPYATIASAYWSPYYRPERWIVPSLPLTRLAPIRVAQFLFDVVRPLAFALHCRPLSAVRRRNGLAPLPDDLRVAYTDADFVLYSDLPELFPLQSPPTTHQFLGPALWEPSVEMPDWLRTSARESGTVYVTLGSSGDPVLLPKVLEALGSLPITAFVATAGRAVSQVAKNVRVQKYLPGIQAASRVRAVVCNGGSLTAYQALAGGARTLGLAGNLDQFLNMQAFERAGLGRTVRADRFDRAQFSERLLEIVQQEDLNGRATRWLDATSFAARASQFVSATLS